MVKRFKIMYPLANGNNEKRNAYVYLPESYYENRRKRYPVLYMFDGHNVFFDSDATYGKCWGMKEYMDATGTELIIAAVECNHSPDNGRLQEYSPYTFNDSHLGHIVGRGEKTMHWFINKFKVRIDKNYRTLPDRAHTFIAGSSMGGLMSVYALMKFNHVFSRAAALSPSLWTSPIHLQNLISKVPVDPDTVLYMDYGSGEFGNHDGMKAQFGEFAALMMGRGIHLTCRIVPGGTHCEASWERQIPFFMNTLMYDYDQMQK